MARPVAFEPDSTAGKNNLIRGRIIVLKRKALPMRTTLPLLVEQGNNRSVK